MRLILTIALLVVCFHGTAAAVRADFVVTWDGLTRTTVNSSAMSAYGNAGAWGGGSLSRMSIGARSGSYTFPNSITISNQTITGSGTNWLVIDTSSGADQFLTLNIYGTGTVTNVVLVGFVTLTLTNTGGGINLDTLDIQAVGGAGSMAFQIRPLESSVNVVAESNVGGSTTWGYVGGNGHVSGDLFGVQQRTYLFVANRSASTGVASVALYDPDNSWSLVGSSACETETGNYAYDIQWSVGYIGDCPGTVKYGSFYGIYNATAEELAAILEQQPPATTNRVTLNGTATLNNFRSN
jgi:hypothetical protein